MPRTILTGSIDSKSPQPHICSCKFDTILSSQRSPSFVGAVVSRKRHTILGRGGSIGFDGMKRARVGLALVGMAASVAVGAALWPHASDAYAALAAQDDPAELSGIRLNSALRNNPAVL